MSDGEYPWSMSGCTCYRPWMSVTPAPACTLHGVAHARFITTHCRGRHCAHTQECYGPMTWNDAKFVG